MLKDEALVRLLDVEVSSMLYLVTAEHEGTVQHFHETLMHLKTASIIDAI